MQQKCPSSTSIAVWLIAVALIVMLMVYVLNFINYSLIDVAAVRLQQSTAVTMLIDAVSFFIITVLCTYYIHQGEFWARLLLLCYVAFRLLMHFVDGTTAVFDVLLVVLLHSYVGLLLVAFTLLFTPESNAWFKRSMQPDTVATLGDCVRPSVVNAAMALVVIGCGWLVVLNAVTYAFFQPVSDSAMMLKLNGLTLLGVDALIYSLVAVVSLIAVACRRSWGRVVFVAYLCLRLLYQIFRESVIASPLSFDMLVFLFFAFNVVAATLLLCPESNRWFGSKTP